MVKKGLLVLALAALAAGGASAQDEEEGSKGGKFRLSAGVGGFVSSDFGGGMEASATVPVLGAFESTTKVPYFGGGGFVFFDAAYAELTLGVFHGGGKMKSTTTLGGQSVPTMPNTEVDISGTYLNIGLLGKYPFALSNKLSLFPLLGLEYDVCLSVKKEGAGSDQTDGSAGDYNMLWFKLGAGVDFDLTEKIYLRFEALYGIRLEAEFEKDMVSAAKAQAASMNIAGADVNARLGHGLTAKLAVGYQF